MKKIIELVLVTLVVCVSFCGCRKASPRAGEECVLTYRPWFFGHGGVEKEAVKTGLTWCVFTTSVDTFKVIPVKNQVDMEDLVSNDNTPLDFHTVIITQVIEGKSPILLENYGKDWFSTNIYNHYCNRVRDYVSQHSPFDLMSNREVLNSIDEKVLTDMKVYVKNLSSTKEFPIVVKDVIIGRAIPNAEQLAEMNKTAQEVQAKQTQERRAEAQAAREKAERQRAIADKAYMQELNLSPKDFIALKWIETIAEKKDANIDVMVGNSDPIWNIRR